MNVKEAVKTALQYASDLFEPEHISNLGLEEVEFDDANKVWDVTIGFSRPWDYANSPLSAMVAKLSALKRDYKIIRVNNNTGDVISVKHRDVKYEP